MMLKREVTHKLQKAPTNSSAVMDWERWLPWEGSQLWNEVYFSVGSFASRFFFCGLRFVSLLWNSGVRLPFAIVVMISITFVTTLH